ncbi:leukocyte immunoglobulin-like receptor subfamily A member 5 isoform X2 [Psammomys obesus]|uniref:leukocyte immunoglobulin-like receptor subfamily A member 5 isoform X2 n=1 Tax=Psammomys obesus TaxID=48139 RepID=UPI002452EF9A|nr:leukocyte immunoglobulin-like receptor subfamily A member 5 isoform X2 [Psammomys obesus]XP_055451664.1 leukocyte immunoglobulin-like receptor subfamily A member 5 isoform X2 [Psammomys obesus]XP_055451665.1 leukocyte immunoglobulin-like receptor subfamily A member 5 isoform X2 [Psammomys obesus]
MGLSLGYEKAVLAGTIAAPTIWAEPDSVVTWRTTVSIWCQGIFEALEYHLDKEGSPSPLYRQTSPKNKNKVNFTISFLADRHAGRYHCYYVSPAGWSKRSDPLELVVTGFYRKPTLSVLPTSAEISGGKMTFQCDSSMGYDRFILTEEGEHSLSRIIHAQHVPNRQFQALFPVGPVTLSQKWTYRCYGNYKINPYAWSESSDPLELLVSDSHSQDHSVENIVRITLAALVLVILGILLIHAYRMQRRTSEHNGYI